VGINGPVSADPSQQPRPTTSVIFYAIEKIRYNLLKKLDKIRLSFNVVTTMRRISSEHD